MSKSKIKGVGFYVPRNVVKNTDLENIMDTNDKWIKERTGIEERRWVDNDLTTSQMGTYASEIAIKNAKISKEEIDFIIFATLSPDYYFPGCGVLIQNNLNIREVGALDIRNQCSGFIYGISIADQYIRSGMYKNILVVGSEIHSGALDKSPRGRSVSVIFGDGAGAAIISKSNDKSEILSTHLHSEGKYAKELAVIQPSTTFWVDKIINNSSNSDIGFYPNMNGNFVFKNAVLRFEEVINEALNFSNYKTEDIDILITHQANLRISKYLQKKLNLEDDKVFNNIMKYGNTTAASIPIAISEALENKKIKNGDLVCLAAFGSGFTWASALIRW
ncbi:MAG: 3-oxoacyl-ACP synthase [Flammeovirgaceae bacterium]|mgnify:FL=1|nr:3-oxoacyl-ACP synthase [Flammeovirgaceae bacterium]|tara:strand:- start:1940 stop:2938 length:999 start_codon:yes stop_codon:yes gene_type:complete